MEEKYKNCPIVGCRVECGSVPCKSLRKTFGIDDEPQKRKTNADRIRAMSDEELAEFLILSPEIEFDVCRFCKFGNPTPSDCRGMCLNGYGACDAESNADAFKKWLKQPVEVDND